MNGFEFQRPYLLFIWMNTSCYYLEKIVDQKLSKDYIGTFRKLAFRNGKMESSLFIQTKIKRKILALMHWIKYLNIKILYIIKANFKNIIHTWCFCSMEVVPTRLRLKSKSTIFRSSNNSQSYLKIFLVIYILKFS